MRKGVEGGFGMWCVKGKRLCVGVGGYGLEVWLGEGVGDDWGGEIGLG